MIFAAGDEVKFHGYARRDGSVFIMAGDTGTVLEPNEDEDDSVRVEFEDGSILVSADDLEWLG